MSLLLAAATAANPYAPGPIASGMLALVAIGLILSIIGAAFLLLVMAAQAVVLGRPTLPPRGP